MENNTIIAESANTSATSIEWSCRSKSERRYPSAEWDTNFLFAKVTKVEHAFLQALVNSGGLLTNMMGEWTFYGVESSVMFHIYDDFVNLECISTYADGRGKGSATQVMKVITECAKETGTEIRLRACNVTGNGWQMTQHPVIAAGMSKKGKIPVGKLAGWYAKFGFTKVAGALDRKGKRVGVNMIFNPQNKY